MSLSSERPPSLWKPRHLLGRRGSLVEPQSLAVGGHLAASSLLTIFVDGLVDDLYTALHRAADHR